MPFFTAQFIFSRCREGGKVEKGDGGGGGGWERDRALLFLCGGSRWHPNEPWPQPLTHSLIYTRQYPHNLCHSSYCSTPLPHHYFMLLFPMCAHTQHLQMSYLHHCCRQSWVTAIDTSHLAKAADHERSMALMKMAKGMWEWTSHSRRIMAIRCKSRQIQ